MSLPEGHHTITPYFTVTDADQLIKFVVVVFGGDIVVENRYSDGTIQHARIRIGDTVMMLNQSNENYAANASQMYLYVEDVESVYSKAISQSAVSIMEPNNREYGDHIAGITDPCGNTWCIAKHGVSV